MDDTSDRAARRLSACREQLTRQALAATVCFAIASPFFAATKAQAKPSASEPWQTIQSSDGSSPSARHETSAVAVGERIYLIGGRGNKEPRVYDTGSRKWRALPRPSVDLHHAQPVAIGNTIFIIGALLGAYPNEVGIQDIHAFDTVTETWSIVGSVPTARVRGSTGAVAHNGWIYVVGGNTQGHNGGAKAWLDRYRPSTDTWETLSDAPNARDHFQAALIDGKIVATAGRRTTQPQFAANTISATDIYDTASGNWSSGRDIPTVRAGTVSVAHDGEVIVIGGETATSSEASASVQAYNVADDSWRSLQSLAERRHGAGGAVVAETLHIMAGSLNRGGGPETDSHETLNLDGDTPPNPDRDNDSLSNDDETMLYGTDPDDSDSDDDGLDDGREIALGTSPHDADSDSDGLSDKVEVDTHATDPLDADSDDDALLDGEEVNVHGTDPLDLDSDDDTYSDGAEITAGSDPLDAASPSSGTDGAGETGGSSDGTSTGTSTGASDDAGSSTGVDSGTTTGGTTDGSTAGGNSSDGETSGTSDDATRDAGSGGGAVVCLLLPLALVGLRRRKHRLGG